VKLSVIIKETLIFSKKEKKEAIFVEFQTFKVIFQVFNFMPSSEIVALILKFLIIDKIIKISENSKSELIILACEWLVCVNTLIYMYKDK